MKMEEIMLDKTKEINRTKNNAKIMNKIKIFCNKYKSTTLHEQHVLEEEKIAKKIFYTIIVALLIKFSFSLNFKT